MHKSLFQLRKFRRPTITCVAALSLCTHVGLAVATSPDANADNSAGNTVTATKTGLPAYRGPSIVAEIRGYNRFRKDLQFSNRMTLSRHGIRLESGIGRDGNKPNLFLQDFVGGNVWLVDQAKGLYVSLPPETNESSAQGAATDYSSGMLASKACDGLIREAQGPANWRGNTAIVWLCQLPDESSLRQFFSPQWQIVVREEKSDGTISELRNIKRVAVKSGFFRPPTEFRETTMHELMGGAPALRPFDPVDAVDAVDSTDAAGADAHANSALNTMQGTTQNTAVQR